MYPAQAQSGTIVQGNNFAEKLEWLTIFAQSNTSYVIEVNADETVVNVSLAFSGKNGITITLRGAGANRKISTRTFDNRYVGSIDVSSGITLVLDNNITLVGSVDIQSGGSLIMNEGAAITGSNNNGGIWVGGTFTISSAPCVSLLPYVSNC